MPIYYTSTGSIDNLITTSSLIVSQSFNISGSLEISGSMIVGVQGIKFLAAAVSSSNLNTLDDYEEGTWTPAFNTNVGGSWTYATQVGTYTKIGNLVTIAFDVTLSNATFGAPGGSSGLSITGLPFSAKNYAFITPIADLAWSVAAASASVAVYAYCNAFSTTLTLFRASAATNNPFGSSFFQNNIGTTGFIRGSMTYQTT